MIGFLIIRQEVIAFGIPPKKHVYLFNLLKTVSKSLSSKTVSEFRIGGKVRCHKKKHDFNGFTITLFQDEEGDWVAYFVELPNVSAFGDTPYIAIDISNN